MIRALFTLFLFASCLAMAATPVGEPAGTERAKQLKEYIQKERPRFERRETLKRDVLEELDHLNADQNRVRERIIGITQNQQELTMALDNLSIEFQKQKDEEAAQKKRLYLLLKIVHKIKQDGVLRFIVNGENLGNLAGRVRVLYHTLKSHSQITAQLEERANRLAASEKKVSVARQDLQRSLDELKEQEWLLTSFLEKKQRVLQAINQKQSYYYSALKEYKVVSAQLAALFNNFEAMRDTEEGLFPGHGSLPLPVEFGKVVKSFGREVSERFHTVTYQKGIEIEADHNSPVLAIMPGIVEYQGWVKGLGNVVIVHHGGGFYSLSAHLFKTVKEKGAKVEQGEMIGYVGDTGTSEKPSLYFELRENEKAVDPLLYFSRKALASLK